MQVCFHAFEVKTALHLRVSKEKHKKPETFTAFFLRICGQNVGFDILFNFSDKL